MNLNDIKGITREFLGKFLRNVEFDENEDLFTSGIINSLFAMQLVLFVEQEFDIKVEDDDLKYENFKSLNAIAHLVQGKQE
jgi:methoxymalonate biosynthesis acyl carrier protein